MSRHRSPTIGIETTLAFGTLPTRRVQPEVRAASPASGCCASAHGRGRYAAQETADDSEAPAPKLLPGGSRTRAADAFLLPRCCNAKASKPLYLISPSRIISSAAGWHDD